MRKSYTVLVVLQCAYARSRERRVALQDKTTWLAGLWESHTGCRLAEMLPIEANIVVEVINASPEIGDEPSSMFPPDYEHIKQAIAETGPRVILGCGRVACAALSEMGLHFVEAPHPAWRALSKEKTALIRATLSQELEDGQRRI